MKADAGILDMLQALVPIKYAVPNSDLCTGRTRRAHPWPVTPAGMHVSTIVLPPEPMAKLVLADEAGFPLSLFP